MNRQPSAVTRSDEPVSRPPTAPQTSSTIATTAVTGRSQPCRVRRPGGNVAPSRTAAIGGMAMARRAGMIVASIVMPDAEHQRHDDRARGEHQARLRHRQVHGVEDRAQALGQRHAAEQAEHRGQHAQGEALEQDGAHDLLARRAQRAQGGELPHPLRERDRERVVDHEGADGERDRREREQEVADEVDALADARGIRAGLLVAGAHLRARGQQRLDVRGQLLGRDPLVGREEDRVELSLLVQQLLRRGDVEDGERGAAERLHVTQPRDARDRELLARAPRPRPGCGRRSPSPDPRPCPGRSPPATSRRPTARPRAGAG